MPVQTNMVFARMPGEMAARLRAAGAYFYDWRTTSDESGGDGQVLARLATSFATPDEAVTRFVEVAAAG